ncbi:MAG: hypothetical protein KIT84_12390 [Labilithrix sp.]|nr:hypothetical protein [Labilithrix sp.]MCW5811812.1 hypothetical protein [Labilithrix sp.]
MAPGGPQPYRVPAPPPGPSKPPSRAIAIAANVTMLLVLLGSFGGCVKWGCTYDHLSESAGFSLAFGAGALCLLSGVVAVVVLLQNRRAHETSSILGLAVTILLTLATGPLSFFFWACTTSSGGIGLGGWGRPLRIGRRAVTPGVRASKEWARGPRPDVTGLDVETRAALRDLWLHDARKEHASVPAFGQVAWQLVALGAPSDLVRRAHESCLQEIDHAERCFALASAYAGRDLGVQEMPALHAGGAALPKDRVRALTQVATEALVDGALLEDYNAALAATALDAVRDPAAREALVRIVEDESAHARLAWDIIAFCVERGGAPVVAALERRFAEVPPEPVSLYEESLARRVAALPDKTPLWAHGRVDTSRAGAVFTARLTYARTHLAALTTPLAAAA